MFFPRKIAYLVPAFALAMAGCGTSAPDVEVKTTASTRQSVAQAEPAPTATPQPLKPKPDATRLKYDPSTRTLAVYDPPVPGARWMMSTLKEPRGVPVEGTYQFPPMVDLDRVSVFYTAANGKASQAVSLREIVEAREIR